MGSIPKMGRQVGICNMLMVQHLWTNLLDGCARFQNSKTGQEARKLGPTRANRTISVVFQLFTDSQIPQLNPFLGMDPEDARYDQCRPGAARRQANPGIV